ncbi:hypothetical protein MTR_4g131335 [Medicago truncatula]|uniref:Uncharacterized protein n=1 Tax=Medicago truncatula TaxID=3880 RepID=A0A072USJ2_MEDTR|nr:hypothetical protein MTR_4g131335 [Medicago truncatula]
MLSDPKISAVDDESANHKASPAHKIEEDAAVMDGEGGEWLRLAGGGVVVDVVRWICFGWEKKKEKRADERERERGEEMKLNWALPKKGALPEILKGPRQAQAQRGFGNSFQPAIDAPQLFPH